MTQQQLFKNLMDAVTAAMIRQILPGLDEQYFGKIPVTIHVEHGKVTHIDIAGRMFKQESLTKNNGKTVDTRR